MKNHKLNVSGSRIDEKIIVLMETGLLCKL